MLRIRCIYGVYYYVADSWQIGDKGELHISKNDIENQATEIIATYAPGQWLYVEDVTSLNLQVTPNA